MQIRSLLIVLLLPFNLLAQGIDWGTPQNISLQGVNSTSPTIAASEAGNAIAAWLDGTSNGMHASVYDPNTQMWGPFTFFGPSLAPSVGMDSSGNGILVTRSTTTGDILARHYDSGTGTWGAPVIIDGGANGLFPEVAVAPSGNAVVVWRQLSPTQGVGSASYDAGTDVWTVRGVIPSSLAPSSLTTHVAIDASSNAYAIWQRNFTLEIGVSRFDFAAGTWDVTTIVGTGDSPQIAADPSGNSIGIWRTGAGIIQVSRYDAGTDTWSAAEDISPAGNSSSTPDISMDANGNAFGIWNNTTLGVIQVAFYDAGTGTWGAPETISPGGESFPKIAMDSDGNAVAAWLSGSNVNQSVLYLASTGTWQTTPDNISTPGETATEPFIALDNIGNAFADWRRNAPTVVIQANSGVMQIPPDPPQNATGFNQIVRFPYQSERSVFISWEASSSTDVVSYRVYRNGVLVAEISADAPLEFVENCAPFDTQITYEITAVNNLGQESEVAVIIV